MKHAKNVRGKVSQQSLSRSPWKSLLLSFTSTMVLLLSAVCSSYAASPPTITKIFDAPGQVTGGIAGDGNNLYFNSLAKNTGFTYSQVISLDANGVQRWTWDNACPQSGGNMRMTPTISPDGTRLFVGADHGKVFCLSTATGLTREQRIVWEFPAYPSALNKPVRSEIAYDPVAPVSGGGTVAAVYFHGNDGLIYSLNAVTGVQRWTAFDTGEATAGFNGPPPSFSHSLPWSSAPVIGLDGKVYVGSANGFLYCLDPATGARLWRVKLNATGLSGRGEPVEATPAIGKNGWIYVATRTEDPTFPNPFAQAHAYAINPTISTSNPDDASEKIAWVRGPFLDELGQIDQPGVIAGITIDRCGTVYFGDFFRDRFFRFDAFGNPKGEVIAGKICQAPALNGNGMFIFGLSQDPLDRGTRSIQASKVSPVDDPNADWLATEWTAGPGAPGPFGDFFGGVLIRADSTGTTYLADANPDTDTGAVYKFTSGAASMPGDWETLGGGNRRQHKARTYPYTIVELGAYYMGDPALNSVYYVDALGRPIGDADGTPNYINFPHDQYCATWSSSGTPSILGAMAYLTARQYPLSLNLINQAVGYDYLGNPLVWPNAFSGARSEYLTLPAGFNSGFAYDINSSSTVIGMALFGSSSYRVIRWDFDIGTSTWSPNDFGAPAGNQAYAYSVSETLRICGKAKFTVGGPFVGYTTSPQFSDFNLAQPMGTLGGGTLSEARKVHDTAGTVGWAHKHIGASDLHRGFRMPPDVFVLNSTHELPGLPGQVAGGTWASDAYSLNACAQVVGRAQNTSGAYRAFIWRPTEPNLTDLTALVPAGWVLSSAVAISDAGHIVGSGTLNGLSRQWLMFPQSQE